MNKKRALVKSAAAIAALFIVSQFPLSTISLSAKAQTTVTSDAQGDGNVYHVMQRAPLTEMTDNLLSSNWGGWGKGFTRDTITAHDGTSKSVYKAVNPSEKSEAGLHQSVNLEQKAGTFTLGGWSKAQNVIHGDATVYFDYCLMASIVYTDGDGQNFHTQFSSGTHDWEYREITFTAQKPIKTMVVYAFLRSPKYGIAWFDEISLREGKTATTSTFQDMPVQVLQTAPDQNTKAVLKTDDGLEMGLGDSIITSLKIDGTQIANNAYSGFLVRDIAETDKDGIYAFAPQNGSTPKSFKGKQPDLNLNLAADYQVKKDHIAVEGTIKDGRNAKEGRAVQLSYALPITASGWKWGVDILRDRTIETGDPSNIYKELGEGGMPVVDWDSEARSIYHTAVIYNEDLGIALAPTLEFPSYFELEYNGSTNQFILNYFLGIVPEAPDAARFEFVIYKLDDPEWGFRAGMKKYTTIFPEQYEVRVKDQGLWVAWIPLSNVIDPDDFNFRFKEEDVIREEAFFEMDKEILSHFYIEPGDWWPCDFVGERTPEVIEARIKETAKGDTSHLVNGKAARQAIATEFCRSLDVNGNLTWFPCNPPWAPNGAQVHINANPKLPGKFNFYNLYMGKDYWDQMFDMEKCDSVPFDGIYLDELSGWWIGCANFNKAHYKYTTVPLTYSPYFRKPMLHRASTTWEFVKQMSVDLRKANKTIFANKCPDKTSFYTPLVDAMGTEQASLDGNGNYAPHSLERMAMWRTLAYQKAFCVLLNNDYTKFTHDMMDKYFQRSLAFGIFPSPCGEGSDGLQYFASRDMLYERDRDIFKKYMPALKTITSAGWEPVTYAVSDNDKILVERYGEDANEGVYFTVYNDNATSQEVTLDVPLEKLKVTNEASIKELTSRNSVTLQDGKYTVTLEPDQTLVLGLKNPGNPDEPSKPTTPVNPDNPGGDDSPNTGVPLTSALAAIALAGTAAVTAAAAKKKKGK